MLKSCSYCGRIHDRKHQCASKPKRTKEQPTYIDRFRWTQAWKRKRKVINERDKYLCQVCIRDRHNTVTKYNFKNIEVHHIIPIHEDWDGRLEDGNLVCLCSVHHKMAEHSIISRQELSEIVKEQEVLLE